MPQLSSISEGQKEQDPHDLEANRVQSAHLDNGTVSSFSWKALSAKVKDHKTKSPVTILDDCSGIMRAGEMLAIMGPSGSGKTTLLNALAHRTVAAGATTTGSILVNGQNTTLQMIRDLSSYVEQEDALIGSLTVKETMAFAARLSLPSKIDKREARRRVDDLVASFGLQSRADTIVGTPIKKGLSGGQKKRLSIASKLVTNPRILFLDEPTSGLDSALSLEVCSYIKAIAKKHNVRLKYWSRLQTCTNTSFTAPCSGLDPSAVVRNIPAIRQSLSPIRRADLLLWSRFGGDAIFRRRWLHDPSRNKCC